MLTVEIGTFKNIVSFDHIIDLEEIIIVPIVLLKRLWFRGEIRSHRKQISKTNFDVKTSFYSIILP